MDWIKREKPGRPRLPENERRVQIRPTVNPDTKKWLEVRTDSPGRVIDRLVEDANKRISAHE